MMNPGTPSFCKQLSAPKTADDGGIGLAPKAIDIAETGTFEQTKLLRQTRRRAVHFRRVAARLYLQLAEMAAQCRRCKIDPLDVHEYTARPE